MPRASQSSASQGGGASKSYRPRMRTGVPGRDLDDSRRSEEGSHQERGAPVHASRLYHPAPAYLLGPQDFDRPALQGAQAGGEAGRHGQEDASSHGDEEWPWRQLPAQLEAARHHLVG